MGSKRAKIDDNRGNVMGKLIDISNLDYYDKNSIKPLQETVLTLAQTVLEQQQQIEELTMPSNSRNVEIVSWADGTWEQLKAMLVAHDYGWINIYDYWKIGDEREIQLGSIKRLQLLGDMSYDYDIVVRDRRSYDRMMQYINWSKVYEEGVHTSYTDAREPELVKLVLVNRGGMRLEDGRECHFIWQQKNGLSLPGTYALSSDWDHGTQENSQYMQSVTYDDRSFIHQWIDSFYYDALPDGLVELNGIRAYITGRWNTDTFSAEAVNAESQNNGGGISTTPDQIEPTTARHIFLPTYTNIFGYYQSDANKITKNSQNSMEIQWDYYKNADARNKGDKWWIRRQDNKLLAATQYYAEEIELSSSMNPNSDEHLIVPCGCI